MQGYHEYRAQPLCNGFELITTWVNRQKKNEFNPPHTHDGHLSFVLIQKFLKVCIKNVIQLYLIALALVV